MRIELKNLKQIPVSSTRAGEVIIYKNDLYLRAIDNININNDAEFPYIIVRLSDGYVNRLSKSASVTLMANAKVVCE